MKCKIRNTSNTLGCSLQVDKGFRAACFVSCGYDETTLAYAALRLIRHSPNVCDCLVAEAVRRGLSGKKGRPRRYTIRARAALLELPGTAAVVTVSVTAGTVSIKGLRLS